MNPTSKNPEIKGGREVFSGTRVPVQTAIDEFTQGATVDEILESYPTVERWQLEAVLQERGLI